MPPQPERPPVFLKSFLWIVMAALVVMGIFAKRGWLDWRRIAEQNQEIALKIEQARAQKDSLLRQVQALQSDTAQQERVVRQMLGYVRPNETVIEFE